MSNFQVKASFVIFSLFIFHFSLFTAFAQPSPKEILGFHPTDDKTIADWTQISNYFNKLDATSDRVKVEIIGETTLKKPIITAFISSEENIRNLEKYKQINKQLANPRNLKDKNEVETLIANGKTIVAISCSIHSTEIVASQMSMNLAYELATAKDAETLEILNNTILMLIPSSNPDGIDIVANWYRKTLGTFYEGTSPPELYHHYAGHDNNRDWFMLNLKETRAITKLFWKEWFPEIVYDVHQMGQNGARFIIPPFFDPPNPNIPPLILREVGVLGYKMAADLQANRIAGVATNTTFDTWWHGGFRSAPYFHNSIGILSEAASANLMSPVRITEEKMKNQRARGLNSPLENSTSHPQPWRPGIWAPNNIAEIEMIACKSILTMASKFRSNYLRNFYDLNKTASQISSNPTQPMAYVIFAGQGKEEIVSRFIEVLMEQGIEVHKMNRELKTSIAGTAEIHTEVPIGSFMVFLDQPQRNNVEALFAKQVYPQRLNASGEAEVPYDVAGWTLPLQMGIETSPVSQIVEFPHSARQLELMKDINQVRKTLNLDPNSEAFAKLPNPLKNATKIGLYQGFTTSMDEGWTRLVFDNFQIPYKKISDADFRSNKLDVETIILPSISENLIVSGLKKDTYPDEFVGGITEEGVANLKRFVENGGKLICFDDSCELVIKQFGLPIKNVLNGLKRSEFYCPGSILNLEVDVVQPIAKGFKKNVAAYFINSSAFEITDSTKIKSVATYVNKDVLLSGWLLGEKFLNGKTALAEANFGKGKITLFAFRPQHRGQSFATFPFIFNALEK
jgi:Zinc carboxypeptidase